MSKQAEGGIMGRILSLFSGEDTEADLARKAFVQELTRESGYYQTMTVANTHKLLETPRTNK
jgi:hypothetical protein